MDAQTIILFIPALLLGLTVHEFAHGWVAFLRGDSTAKLAGRLTFNPISHLDVVGTAMLFITLLTPPHVPFGWAKPVPINPNNFRSYKKDVILVSIAGPVSNILCVLIFGFLLRFLSAGYYDPNSMSWGYLIRFLQILVSSNLGLSFFNLLPIPPLDGSQILFSVLPQRFLYKYQAILNRLPMIFLVLIFADMFLKIPVFSWLIKPLWRPYASFFNFILTIGQ